MYKLNARDHFNCSPLLFTTKQMQPNGKRGNFEPKINRFQRSVEDYYCAKFQVIPIRDFCFIVLKYTPTYTHTHTHRDKVIATSAPPYCVVSADIQPATIYTYNAAYYSVILQRTLISRSSTFLISTRFNGVPIMTELLHALDANMDLTRDGRHVTP